MQGDENTDDGFEGKTESSDSYSADEAARINYKLGFNQIYTTFPLILLLTIVLYSRFPATKFVNYKCFEMRSEMNAGGREYGRRLRREDRVIRQLL